MTKLMFCLALLFFTNSFAQTAPIRQFHVEKAQYSQAHFESPTNAVFTVNYLKSLVTLEVYRAMPACPTDQVCAQVMPEPVVVELPITLVERDACGIFHVTAEQDFRPIDGALNRIELEDPTEITCDPLTKYEAQAIYETRSISRQSGREVADISTMTIRPIENLQAHEAQDTLNMIKGSFIKGFPSYQTPGTGTLVLGKDSIEMTIHVNMDCTHRVCPRMIPQPLHVELPIVKIEKAECGSILTARKDLQRTDGTLEELEIKDFKTCAPSGSAPTEVHYHSIFNRGYGIYEYEAVFTFAH